MDTKLQKTCDLFIKNGEVFKDAFRWDYGSMCLVGSTLFTNKERSATIEELKNVEQILNEEEGFFSEFRGVIKVAVVSAMALSDNPREYLANVKAIYNKIREGKIFSSEQQALAAMLIYENDKDNSEAVVTKLKELFYLHNKKHPFLTDDDDLSLLAICALSDTDPNKLFNEAEACFNILKEEYPQNAAQSLAMVLSMYEGTPDEKCNKAFYLFDTLVKKEIKLSKEEALSTIGMLSMSNLDFDDIADKIKEVDEFLSKQDGFGPLTINRTTRTMFATLLVTNTYNESVINVQTPMVTSILTEIIIVNLLLMIIIVNNANRMATAH